MGAGVQFPLQIIILNLEVWTTQQNSYSNAICHLQAQWLHSDWTLDSDGISQNANCQQHSVYTVDELCSHRAAGSCQQWLHRHCPVTV